MVYYNTVPLNFNLNYKYIIIKATKKNYNFLLFLQNYSYIKNFFYIFNFNLFLNKILIVLNNVKFKLNFIKLTYLKNALNYLRLKNKNIQLKKITKYNRLYIINTNLNLMSLFTCIKLSIGGTVLCYIN